MKYKRFRLALPAILALLLWSTVSFAATTVVANGRQSRGYPGHNAEIHGDLFSLPGAGSITAVDPHGAAGFWIEKDSGELVRNFNTVAESNGYSLPAGKYRVIPNLKDGVNSCSVAVTFTCP